MVKKKFMVFLFLFINFFGNCYSETEPYSKLENDIAKTFNAGKIRSPIHLYSNNEDFLIKFFFILAYFTKPWGVTS